MKRRILEVDLSRKRSWPPTELEREAQDRARGVVERADLLRVEQEEEIRRLNTVRSSREGLEVLGLLMLCLNAPAADLRCAVPSDT